MPAADSFTERFGADLMLQTTGLLSVSEYGARGVRKEQRSMNRDPNVGINFFCKCFFLKNQSLYYKFSTNLIAAA